MEYLFDECVNCEYKYSVQLQYRLLPWVTDSNNFDRLSMACRYLSEAYDKIVEPMTGEIKDLMTGLDLINEAELFCSDMKYRVMDNKILDKVIGGNSRNDYDTVLMCE